MSAEAEKHIWCCSRCSAIFRKDFPFCPADGGEVISSPADPLIGQQIDHYTIDALIGEGAMGRVYRAHHTQLTERVYAVKVLIGDLAATQEARMRFLDEAKNASRLSHPNVVNVVDVGRSPKGLLYLVMEYVEGTPLADLIKQPMDAMRAARLIRGVCRGLGHAHDNGLVHRDLKPENVLVVSSGDGEVPRIVDFGIAVHADRDGSHARLTATGISLGTPAYVAPEQVSGDATVDALADQYSVGVTLFEMLSGGALPFTGSPHDVIHAKARGDAPSLDDAMPAGTSAPPGLARMVERMLSRRPKDRYASIHDIVRMLTRYIDAPGTVILDERRSRKPLVVAAAIAMIALAAGAIAWQLRDAPKTAVAAASSTPPSPSPPLPVSPPTPPPPPIQQPKPVIAIAEPPPVESPPKRERHRTRTQRARKGKPNKPLVVAEVVPPPAPAALVIEPPPPAPPPLPPSPNLPARIGALEVSGAISHTDVRRATERIAAAIARCTAPGTSVAKVRFTVDDSRRAREIRASGAPAAAVACLTAAFGGLRTESAPDVGNAEVVVQIRFR